MTAELIRMNTFSVPDEALDAFLEQVGAIHARLSTRQGIGPNEIMVGEADGAAGPGRRSVVMVSGWASDEAMTEARESMRAWQAEQGIDPPTFMAELGVEAEFGIYRRVRPSAAEAGQDVLQALEAGRQ